MALIFLQAATDHFLPIHREAPSFVEQSTEQEILVTGIKVWSDRSLMRYLIEHSLNM